MHSIVINVCMGELWRRLFWAKEMENGSGYKYALAFRARDCGRLTGEALSRSILTATARNYAQGGYAHAFVGTKHPCTALLRSTTGHDLTWDAGRGNQYVISRTTSMML